MEILIKILQVVLAFALLIALHEGGHFFFAKLFKIRVEKFYLFFDYKFRLFSTYSTWYRKLRGKAPVKKDDKGEYEYVGTEYGVGWIPLGGYVKISGMIDESMDKEQMKRPPQPWEFRTKPAWQRLLVMLGGVIVNFITAFVIYSMVLFFWGESYVKPEDMTDGLKFSEQAKADGFRDGDIIVKVDGDSVKKWQASVLRDISNAKEVTIIRDGREEVLAMSGDKNLLSMLQSTPIYADARMMVDVDSVLAESPAEKAGLRKGDVITSLAGREIADFNELTYVLSCLSQTLDEKSTHADSLRARQTVMVINGTDSVDVTLTPAFTLGFINKAPEYRITEKTYGFLESIPAGIGFGCKTLGGYVNDLKYVFTSDGAKSVGGIVGIANIFPPVWDWQRFWLLTAFLSIALGFMNVLPIPALDGGHALFAIYEIITRRKPSEKLLEKAQYVGMFLLIALMIFATWNDIARLIGLQ